jgi:hypothetical protein
MPRLNNESLLLPLFLPSEVSAACKQKMKQPHNRSRRLLQVGVEGGRCHSCGHDSWGTTALLSESA